MGTILFSILYGLAFSILIIAWDIAAFLKVVMIVGSLVVMLIGLEGVKDSKEKSKEVRKSFVALVLAVLICEVGLYNHSSYEETIGITVVVTEEQCDCDSDQVNVLIEYFNDNDNTRMVYYRVKKKKQAMIDFYKSVTAAKNHILYTPFVSYSEQTTYTRK